MQSGIWTILVVRGDDNKFLARIPFLVYPSNNDTTWTNHTSTNSNIPENGKLLLKTFQDTKGKKEKDYEKLNESYLKYHTIDLDQWRKLLINEFYDIDSLCRVHQEDIYAFKAHEKPYQNFTFCKATLWSSLSPDPKSFI